MKLDKNTIKSKKFQNVLGWLTLAMLIALLGIKLLLGHCELWICGLFVAIVTAYFILSDFGSNNKKGSS